MKFGFLSTMDGSPWGGSEDLWSEAANLLLDEGHAVTICVRGWGGAEAPPLKRLDSRGAVFHRRFLPRTQTTLGLVRDKIYHRFGLSRPSRPAPETFAAEHPDFALVTLSGGFPDPAKCGPLARLDVPHAYLFQSASEHWWPDDTVRRDAITLLRSARAVFFVSEGNRRLVERQLAYAHPRASVVRNPFRVPYETIPAWPATASPLRLATVGRLDPGAKGCDLALEALARPAWRERDLVLTFFGSGQSDEGVRALASRLGLGDSVRFAGHVADIGAIWKEHHALLMPSRYEGMPLAVIEAMLCGRPCIATDVAGHAEFVIEGRTGFLAPAATIDAVDAALGRAFAARERWPALGAESARLVRNLVSPSPARRLSELLLKLARES